MTAPATACTAQPCSPPLDPISSFLLDSLVLRPTLLERNGVHFVSVRRWRADMKPYQIEALRLIKRDPSARFVNAVTHDVLSNLESFLGGRVYRYVVPMPCSRSLPDACLPTLIAEKIAARLGLTLLQALACDPADGKSHPRRNLDRSPLRLIAPVPGPAILIDDVATSGSHIEEASRLLLPHAQALFAIAWIGGGSTNGHDQRV